MAGPEWHAGLRTGVGAATSATLARLTGIEVASHGAFDRIIIGFEGPLPGYRIGFGPAAEPGRADILIVLLEHVQATGRRALDPGLPAIEEVRRAPSHGGTVRTTVTVESGEHLPFRVGLAPGIFYVDVAHGRDAVTER